MSSAFERDIYPGKPKILFIGLAHSTHTHAWIDLLSHSDLNVRLFALPNGLPPESWKVKTYITMPTSERLNPETRHKVYPPGRFGKIYARAFSRGAGAYPARELAQVIRRWKPDVIHTLGLEPASYFYDSVRQAYGLEEYGKWVVQARGGPDLALHRLLPEYSEKIRLVMEHCQQLIADNVLNYEYAVQMGLSKSKTCPLGILPGTGGVDVSHLSNSWKGVPSRRRIILFPKAYDCPQSKALPVFEALKSVMDKIQPCQIHMLAVDKETRMWYQTLPGDLRAISQLDARVPRQKVLDLMLEARVMLAPSLSDGIPNSLYESMACGVLPILSPLETIRSVVGEPQNLLFARNLYPGEIADALLRAMNDDILVDKVASNNLELVRQIANREIISTKVVDYYRSLVS